jgi:hypothetical protein
MALQKFNNTEGRAASIPAALSVTSLTLTAGLTVGGASIMDGSDGVNIAGLPEYANNAAAIGATPPLVEGDLYRTAAGAVMVVLPA